MTTAAPLGGYEDEGCRNFQIIGNNQVKPRASDRGRCRQRARIVRERGAL